LETKEDRKKILIIGIAGGLARLLARLIHQHNPEVKIIGVDNRTIKDDHQKDYLTSLKIKYSRGSFEKIFRSNQFDTVYHLGRLGHVSSGQRQLAKRLNLSIMGTNHILNMCLENKVRNVIVLSTFHVYGAIPNNSVFLDESSPLKASIKYPQLRDVVEVDQLCSSWMWKNKDQINTVILRPCNIIGTTINNSISQFLKSHLGIKVIDFNPMFQFIHEYDMANVLYKCITQVESGIYNISTNDFIGLNKAQKLIGKRSLPIAMSLGSSMNKVLKIFNLHFSEYLIDYFKFSCLIDNSEIKKQLGDHFWRYSTEETLELIKLG